jgi:hypothetical protein
MIVVNCNSYNIFSCGWNLIRLTCKLYNVFLVITVITDFTKNRLAIQALPYLRSSNIAYLDTKGQLIERVNISNEYSKNISLRDGTIKCTDGTTIYCFTLTGENIWTKYLPYL